MVSTPNFEQPTLTKIFLGLLPYHPTFQLKHNIFVFSFLSSMENKLTIFCHLYIVLLHVTIDAVHFS